MPKCYLPYNVHEAAQKRIAFVFDEFEKIYISFSGGKDSTVMAHLVMEEAIKRNRKVGLFFLDWECQFKMTIDHIRHIYEMYRDHIEPWWICLPIRTESGCSQFETEWVCWDENKKDLWVRQPEPGSISDIKYFPFYFKNMQFEEFVPLFGQWWSEGKLTANFIGIRTMESLNRYRTIASESKDVYKKNLWTTKLTGNLYNIYPIYDWQVEDDWTYFGKTGKPYNPLYDRMYQAGLTLSQMRIDEPFGETQRKGLWLYQIIEPKTWAKMVLRVAGANNAALYTKEMGNILGNGKVSLPKGHTWESFAKFLLNTMPSVTAEHYRNKIAVYIRWYYSRGYPDGIPDAADYRLEQEGKVPSWRRIVKTLLRNDYWCKGIGFSRTKSEAYGKYMKLMKKRRKNWNLFTETLEQGELL